MKLSTSNQITDARCGGSLLMASSSMLFSNTVLARRRPYSRMRCIGAFGGALKQTEGATVIHAKVLLTGKSADRAMLNEKITCSAFGCKRWTRRIEGGAEIHKVYLCTDHWPMVPKRLRRLMNKAFRRQDQPNRTFKDVRRTARLWQKCVDHANRNQFGI